MIRIARIRLIMVMLIAATVGISGCCSSYSYFRYRSRAEDSLRKRRFKQAKELYSTIYSRENKAKNIDLNRTSWAFYRLGVIAEILGDLRMAKGYYWGDKIDEGFYEGLPEVDWLAQAGWDWLDEGNPPRSLEEILELEARGRPIDKVAAERKKREIILPEKAAGRRPDTFDMIKTTPQRTFNRSLTPPPANAAQPFRVYH